MTSYQLSVYSSGVMHQKSGLPDENPYGLGSLHEYCLWSAGYFDSMRGMV